MSYCPIINFKGFPGIIIKINGENDYLVFVEGNLKRLFNCSRGWGEIHEENGRTFWIVDGEYHREDGPAAIYPNGTLEWYKNGKLHRNDGPAVIETYLKWWYKDGELHRDNDLPAYEDSTGYREWYIEGKKIKTTKL